MISPTAPPFDIDPALETWLMSEVGLVRPLRGTQIAGGWSNVTAAVRDDAGREVIVRMPPAGRAHGGAHDVVREARIMRALGPTAVPVPEIHGWRTAGEGAGSPVYAMQRIEGVVVDSEGALAPAGGPGRKALAHGLVEVLAGLQEVNLNEVGLDDLRRSAPYVERQLRRWSGQWSATATREVPAVDRAGVRLGRAASRVRAGSEGLVHGDFRLGNVMVAQEDRSRIVALLDWELCTVGHPLADIGFLGARLTAPASVLTEGRDPLAADGMPSFDELVEDYARLRGVDVDPAELAFFVALSAWRWAIIVEGIQRRYADGVMGAVDGDVQWQRDRVEHLAALAEVWLDRTGS